MQHFAKPENALKRAEELCAVGQRDAALVGMYDVLSSKRHRTWQPAMEQVMMRYLDLCVDMRKAKAAKDGLIQYRMVCQQVNVGSMEAVLRHFMELADRAAGTAISKAEEITGQNMENLLDFDDLEAEETPESLMMATVGGGADSKKRTDRQVVTPSLKFLWEAYRTVLDVLRNNSKLDELYRDTCLKAFAFCTKYKRVVEFRRLCEILRNHIQAQTKLDPRWKEKELPTAEAMQTHLETRFSQLSTAIEMELWQEAYRTVEDVHAMLSMMPIRPKAKPMANYHAQLARIFWVAGNTLFHAMSLLRLLGLTKAFGTQPPKEELTMLASRAVLATLATPLDAPVVDVNLLEYDLEYEKRKRMATMLSFPPDLSRAMMIEEIKSRGVLELAMPEVAQLFALTEAGFYPLELASKVEPLLGFVAGHAQLAQYDGHLRRLVGLRLLQQMEQVYLTVTTERVVSAVSLLSWPQITDLILWAAKRDLVMLRIDEKNGQLRQRATQASATVSAEVRDTLSRFASSLEAVAERLHAPALTKSKVSEREALFDSIGVSVEREHEKVLARRLIIERRKEEAERLTMEEDKERSRQRAARLKEEEETEKAKIAADQKQREEERAKAAIKEEEEAQARKFAEHIAEQRKNMKVAKKTEDGKRLVETSVEALTKKDRQELLKEQRELVQDERAEFEKRLEGMSKRHDHLERARREEERLVLAAKWEEQQVADKATWEDEQQSLKQQLKIGREHDLKEKERFTKMTSAVSAFTQRVMSARREAHVAVVAAWREEQERRKEELRKEKQRLAAEEKAKEEALERARRAAEEEEARRIQEKAEAERKKLEAEEERKRVAEKQKQREREMEEKAKKDALESQAARAAEREKSGRSWALDDDDDELPPPPSSFPGAKEADKPKSAEAKATRNEERWEGHRMDRGATLGRGDDRGQPARGGGDPRGQPRDDRVPPGRGDRFDDRGPPRRDGPPPRDGDGRWSRDPRSGPRDDPQPRDDRPPHGRGDRFEDRGPPRRDGNDDRFKRDGQRDGGPSRDDRFGGDRGPAGRGMFDRERPPRDDGDDRWSRDPRSGPRDGPPPRDDRFGGKGGKGDAPPPRSGFGDRGRDGDDRFGGKGGKGDGPSRGGFGDRNRDGSDRRGGGDREGGGGSWRR